MGKKTKYQTPVQMHNVTRQWPYWYKRIHRDVIVTFLIISIPEAIEDVAVYTI